MLITNHIIYSTLISKMFKLNPATAFLAGVGSHLVLDSIPHWGPDKASPNADKDFLAIARVDGVVGASLTLAICKNSNFDLSTMACLAGAIAPDLDIVTNHFFGKVFIPKAFSRFHGRIQIESADRISKEFYFSIVGAALLLLTRRLSKATT